MATVLIIDDDKAMCQALMQAVTAFGHQVSSAHNLADGLKRSMEIQPDVVFLDVHLPDGSGLSAMASVRSIPSAPEVIIFTGAGDPDAAELAIRGGAWDYIEKPATVSALALPLQRALQYRAEKITHRTPTVLKRDGIVGDSPRLQESLAHLARAAASDVTVLLTGETGTGKELFAAAIHQNSPRAKGNFVIVDCTALPETLVESLLFGHERGAFTGAERATEGLIRQADGGTLFLDEAGELPLPVQRSFLRVLQERRFRPLGSKFEVESDFRLVAATNRDLDAMVAEGTFRDDLLFRLRSFHLEIPPLRDRLEDIRSLVTYHLDRLGGRTGGPTKGVSPEFIEALESYRWPGNVRELVLTLEQAMAAAHSEAVLHPYHLPLNVRINAVRSSLRKPDVDPAELEPQPAVPTDMFPTLKDFRTSAVDAAERQYLRELMIRTGNDVRVACELSGLSRPRLYALMGKHRITRRSL